MTAPPMLAPAEMVALVTEYTASAVPKSMAHELSKVHASSAAAMDVSLGLGRVVFIELCQVLY